MVELLHHRPTAIVWIYLMPQKRLVNVHVFTYTNTLYVEPFELI